MSSEPSYNPYANLNKWDLTCIFHRHGFLHWYQKHNFTTMPSEGNKQVVSLTSYAIKNVATEVHWHEAFRELEYSSHLILYSKTSKQCDKEASRLVSRINCWLSTSSSINDEFTYLFKVGLFVVSEQYTGKCWVVNRHLSCKINRMLMHLPASHHGNHRWKGFRSTAMHMSGNDRQCQLDKGEELRWIVICQKPYTHLSSWEYNFQKKLFLYNKNISTKTEERRTWSGAAGIYLIISVYDTGSTNNTESFWHTTCHSGLV